MPRKKGENSHQVGNDGQRRCLRLTRVSSPSPSLSQRKTRCYTKNDAGNWTLSVLGGVEAPTHARHNLRTYCPEVVVVKEARGKFWCTHAKVIFRSPELCVFLVFGFLVSSFLQEETQSQVLQWPRCFGHTMETEQRRDRQPQHAIDKDHGRKTREQEERRKPFN